MDALCHGLSLSLTISHSTIPCMLNSPVKGKNTDIKYYKLFINESFCLEENIISVSTFFKENHHIY